MTTLPDAPRAEAAPPAAGDRRPFRDNPRLLLLGIGLLLAALVALVTLADRSAELNPDFLTEVVLYAVSAADLTMLVVLAFVLARNVVKLLVERRRGLPFSRFRAKLVLAMLALTIVPSVLVLIVGGELIRSSTDRWLHVPVEDVLGLATQLAGDYYGEREAQAETAAARIAGSLAPALVEAGDPEIVRRSLQGSVSAGGAELVEVYRVSDGGQRVEPIASAAASALPAGATRTSSEQLARRVATGAADPQVFEPLSGGSEIVRAGAPVKAADGRTVGVVVATAHLSRELATHARRISEAYEKYNELRVLRRPLQGIYLSLFLTMTLLILVSATWMGVYVAKRITRPVQRLAAGAREIGAGHLDHRIEPETRDEFGALVEAFNAMASGLAASQRKIARSQEDLERKNRELDERRRYIETVLERIATGVVSLDADGRIETINTAALRLLGVSGDIVGTRADDVFAREDLEPLQALIRPVARRGADPVAREFALVREGRELHLAAAATPLQGQDGRREGIVLVFDDVTPLIRTQRVAAWRDVARRLAHEIKNPLTPIRLCAERLRRQFGTAPPAARELVEECTATIVSEVDSLKDLVDEFAQFARMPAPRQVPADLNAVVSDALALYQDLFSEIRMTRRFDPGIPRVRVDVEQLRRVVINLVDNAVEVLGGAQAGPRPDGSPPAITLETVHDPVNGVVRLVVSDNGPGIPPGDRDKLFMPYYSTKRRGSGLGLAIVRRIIAEHGGSIEVAGGVPSGTVFTIELPVPAAVA
jgi:two-component system nitrogen regulation sensor histidine kinase NtrY